MASKPNETEFLKHLRSEKLKAEEARTTYTLRKLAYATTLLGLGSLDIDVAQITAIGPINLGHLLYLAPWVALAFDLYILAEDYSVKRFGAFLWKNSPDVLERGWEEWVSENRDPRYHATRSGGQGSPGHQPAAAYTPSASARCRREVVPPVGTYPVCVR